MSTSAAATRRVPGSLLGMILFVSSEIMFFGGLGAVWFSRRSAVSPWPPEGAHLGLAIPAALTVSLLASSVVVHKAVAASDSGETARAVRLLLTAIVMGLAFLTGQAYEYSVLGFGVSEGAFATSFYALTGFHGLHVLIGVAILGIAVAQLRRGHIGAGKGGDLEAAALYWHFVDAVWIGVFLTVYVIG